MDSRSRRTINPSSTRGMESVVGLSSTGFTMANMGHSSLPISYQWKLVATSHSKPLTRHSWAKTRTGTHGFSTTVLHTNRRSSYNAHTIFVRKFTVDYEVSIKLDPFGFPVKNLHTRMSLIRCDSSGELYPFTPSPPTQNPTPSSLIALSNNLWHNHLGYPEVTILNSLRRNNFILCNKSRTILFVGLVNLENK